MAEENNITLTIDGREVSVPRGSTILDAANELGIDIPTFCWHPKLKPVGACRICYVEIEKRPKLEVACASPAMSEMVVITNSEKVLQGRRAVLEFILANHPLDCPTCDKGGECDLQDLTFKHGTDDSRFDFKKNRFIRDKNSTFDDYRLGPEVIRNQNRCILCYKCVRSSNDIFGEYELAAYQRGNETEIDTIPGHQLDSIYSGNAVEICPVGALTNTDWRYQIRVWNTEKVDSICSYCADGCNLSLWRSKSKRDKVFRVTSRRNDAIDEGWICDVGRYGYQPYNSDSRLTTPMIKKGDTQVAVSWEEAIGLIARRFKEIKEKKGGVCIGGIINPMSDNNSLYAFSKFLRTTLHSNNVDYRSDYKMLPEKTGDFYSRMSSRNFSIADIEKSDLILVVGSNLIKEHPIVNLRVRKAVTQLGATLFTLNPFVTKSGDISEDEIIYNPGTLVALLNGLGITAAQKSKTDSESSQMESLVTPSSVAEISQICGVSADRINLLAEKICNASRITIIGGELITICSDRDQVAAAIHNLALLTGTDKTGQVGLLSKYSNSKGAEKLGLVPHLSDNSMARLKKLWGACPDSDGLATDRMIHAAGKDDLDSLFVIGTNLLQSYPDGMFIKDGLEKLDFLVVADLYETETTAMADVVLPISGWAETSGDFINLEGRLQRFNAAIKTVGHALPVYEIITRIAAELKNPICESTDQFDKEVSSLLSGDTAEPFPEKIQEVRYDPEEADSEFPYPLFIVDERHHFGHFTEKSNSLSKFCGEAFLEMSPSTAEKLRAENGTLIRVESKVGKIILPIKISDCLENDALLVCRNFSASPINQLQMRKRKVDRVKLTRVEEE